uniref:C2 domain-containing protein n=1 Tax=Panagrellus redivivus TaxID=6233 RepID=A0A7E4UZ92_PANRE
MALQTCASVSPVTAGLPIGVQSSFLTQCLHASMCTMCISFMHYASYLYLVVCFTLWPGSTMLQTKAPLLGNCGRTMRSNSLNVPDGAVALSITIPDGRTIRKSSVCSCSKCSFVSDQERPRSGMSDMSFETTDDQKLASRPQSEFNLDTLTDNYSARGITHRSASADYFRRKSFSSDSQNQQSPSPPTGDELSAPISRSSSRASSLSTRPSIDFSSGQLKFKLNYNLEMGSLDVHVIECRDLPHFGKHNPNPIVYVSLLPDDGYLEHSRVKTKCRKNTYNPLFGEVLKFPNLTKFELDDRILQFSVYHVDAFTKKSVIGECQVRIEDYPWSMTEPIWVPLRKNMFVEMTPPDPEIHTRRGILRFEISFTLKDQRKQRGDIHFFVKSGNNLTGDPPVLCKMPFIKANLMNRQKSILRSARSALAEFHGNGHEPVWNYDLVIQDQSLEKLKDRILEISVWDRENSLNNRYIGRLLFHRSESTNSEKSTQSLWRRLLETPKAKFVAELQLQP